MMDTTIELQTDQLLVQEPLSGEIASAYGRLLLITEEEGRDGIQEALRGQGHTVFTATNGRQAWERLVTGAFDVVLLDKSFPEMENFELLCQLKADLTLSQIPVLVLAESESAEQVVKCITLGAEDYFMRPVTLPLLLTRIAVCLEKRRLQEQHFVHLRQLSQEKRRSDALLEAIIPIGVALLAEKDFHKLLERIVLEARSFCNADGGSLYLRTEEDTMKFVVMQAISLDIAMGGTTGVEIPFPPLPLLDSITEEPNHRYVVTHVALTGNSINIPDAYDAQGFDFSGTKAFDARTGYRSTSFLTVPLTNNSQEVIGVLQLLNALCPVTGNVIPFDENMERIMRSLSSLAAIALEAYLREQRLRRQVEELRFEIDQAKKAREVQTITESDYFRALQERARTLRGLPNKP